jgi:hypothetical protein
MTRVATLRHELVTDEARLPLALFVNHPAQDPTVQYGGGVSLPDRKRTTFVQVDLLPELLRGQVMDWLAQSVRGPGDRA